MWTLLNGCNGLTLSAGVIGGLGMPELIVILIVVLLVFGPKNLPNIGKALGGSLREFKQATQNLTGEEPPPKPAPKAERPAPGKTSVSEKAMASAEPAPTEPPRGERPATEKTSISENAINSAEPAPTEPSKA